MTLTKPAVSCFSVKYLISGNIARTGSLILINMGVFYFYKKGKGV